MIITSILLVLLPVILIGTILGFEIWMFVDVLRNPNIASDRRIIWAIGMLLIHPFVAIIYFFTDHKRIR